MFVVTFPDGVSISSDSAEGVLRELTSHGWNPDTVSEMRQTLRDRCKTICGCDVGTFGTAEQFLWRLHECRILAVGDEAPRVERAE